MAKKKRVFTAPTLERYRGFGYHIDETERHVAMRITKDLFGFGDFLAFKRVPLQIVIVQSCAKTDRARRRDKILANPIAREWIEMGSMCRIHLVCWGDDKPPQVHVLQVICLADFLKSIPSR